jgi:curved DNA-binding protein CbpA
MPDTPLTQKDPYQLLGVSPDTSMEEIKKIYFSLCKEYAAEKHGEVLSKLRTAYRRIRLQRQRDNDFLNFPQANQDAQFQQGNEAVADVEDDLLDMEMWRLNCKQQ